MNWAESTTTIMDLVEQTTGKPISLEIDPKLAAMALVVMARANEPAHRLVHRPSAPNLDYLVAFQCGFVLRLYECVSAERFEFAASSTGKASVRTLVTEAGGELQRMGLPKDMVLQVADQMLAGLLTQLRSVPIGMRIESWLWETYPDLHAQQKDCVGRQLRDNTKSLGPQIRDMTPGPIYSGNASMNCAYALFADRLFGMPLYAVPYRSAGFIERGSKLLKLLDDLPGDPAHDRLLVDAWGEELGLSDWFKWVPLDAAR